MTNNTVTCRACRYHQADPERPDAPGHCYKDHRYPANWPVVVDPPEAIKGTVVCMAYRPGRRAA